MLNKSEMYWDAARANFLLDHYERLEAAAREVCALFPASQPFGNLIAALEQVAHAKQLAQEAGTCGGL